MTDADGNLEGDPATPQDRVNAFDAEGKAVTFENASVVYDAFAARSRSTDRGSTCTARAAANWGRWPAM